MKRLILAFILALSFASVSDAQTITCTVTGLSAVQRGLVDEFLADLNAKEAPGAPFASFEAFCAHQARSTVLSFIARKRAEKLQRVGAIALSTGDDAATNAQCAAAGLSSGCKKSQVACFVLIGNTTCIIPEQ